MTTHPLPLLSPLGIGTAPLGGLYHPANPTQAIALLHHALANGLRYFDSALFYGGGMALEILGAALGPDPQKDYPGLVLSFKVGRIFVDGPSDPLARGKTLHTAHAYPDATRPFVFDYSAPGVRTAFQHSIDALNRGRAKHALPPLSPQNLTLIVYVHDPDPAVHGPNQPAIMQQVLTEAFPELYAMQQQNLLHAYGIGTNEIAPCLAALQDPHIKLLMLAGRGTLLCNGAPAAPSQIQSDAAGLDQLVATLASHPNTPKLALAAIGNSGLAYGAATYNYAPASPQILAFRDTLFAAVKNFNTTASAPVSITQLLIQYPFAALGDSVATVVPGPNRIADIDQLLAAARAGPVPQALWTHLAAQGLIQYKT